MCYHLLDNCKHFVWLYIECFINLYINVFLVFSITILAKCCRHDKVFQLLFHKVIRGVLEYVLDTTYHFYLEICQPAFGIKYPHTISIVYIYIHQQMLNKTLQALTWTQTVIWVLSPPTPPTSMRFAYHILRLVVVFCLKKINIDLSQ